MLHSNRTYTRCIWKTN